MPLIWGKTVFCCIKKVTKGILLTQKGTKSTYFGMKIVRIL